MKKTLLLSAVVLGALLFTSCNGVGGGTPENSSTKLWPAVAGDYYGYIDAAGKFAIPATYTEALEFSCGYALARISGGSLFFIDANGQTQTNAPSFDRVGSYFFYNHCRYQINDMWGMMDHGFKTVIQPAYYELGSMTSSGLVLYRQTSSSKYGYLNNSGKEAITSLYDDAWGFEDGVAVVRMGNNYGAIDKDGKFVISPMYPGGLQSIGEGRIGFYDQNSGKLGMMDLKGTIVVPAMYDDGYFFTDNGLIAVSQNGQMGYLDKNGNIKLPLIYYQAMPFYNGLAWIQRTSNSNVEAIDATGNTVLTLGTNEGPEGNFHNGLCLVCSYSSSNGTYSYRYIDKKGGTIYAWTETSPSSSAPARKPAEHRLDVEKLFRHTEYGYRFEK